MPNPNKSAEKLDDSATLSMGNALIVEPIKNDAPNITALDPLSNAGFFLAKFVLSIISGALIIILSALAIQEYKANEISNKAYQAIIDEDDLAAKIKERQELADASISMLKSINPSQLDNEMRLSLLRATESLNKYQTRFGGGSIINQIISDITAAISKKKIDFRKISAITIHAEAFLQNHTPPQETADHVKARESLVKSHLEAMNAGRDFWSKMSQMILLNLLLPTLTGILGYVFASRSNSITSSSAE